MLKLQSFKINLRAFREAFRKLTKSSKKVSIPNVSQWIQLFFELTMSALKRVSHEKAKALCSPIGTFRSFRAIVPLTHSPTTRWLIAQAWLTCFSFRRRRWRHVLYRGGHGQHQDTTGQRRNGDFEAGKRTILWGIGFSHPPATCRFSVCSR